MPSLPPPQKAGAEEPLPQPAGHVIQRPGYVAEINEDGRLIFDSDFLRTGLDTDPVMGPRLAATFDLGDMLSSILSNGQSLDPYVSDKLDLLHDTFAQRVALREANDALVMDRAIANLPDYLLAVWNEPNWDHRTKRRVLFALWDECAEQGNDTLREGGKRARQAIERFIATVLPEGSPHGYNPTELAALNHIRTSQARFEVHESP
jgi:hypothetical protein